LAQLAVANPTSAALWYELGVRQIAKDQVENARRSLERTLSLQSDFAPAHVQLGILAEKASDMAAARAEYQRALEIDPANSDAQKRLDDLPKA
jgi:Flp pilus assembly protein TadD